MHDVPVCWLYGEESGATERERERARLTCRSGGRLAGSRRSRPARRPGRSWCRNHCAGHCSAVAWPWTHWLHPPPCCHYFPARKRERERDRVGMMTMKASGLSLCVCLSLSLSLSRTLSMSAGRLVLGGFAAAALSALSDFLSLPPAALAVRRLPLLPLLPLGALLPPSLLPWPRLGWLLPFSRCRCAPRVRDRRLGGETPSVSLMIGAKTHSESERERIKMANGRVCSTWKMLSAIWIVSGYAISSSRTL